MFEDIYKRLEHMEDNENFIEHYGIPGMRWGKRKTKSINKLSSKELQKRIARKKLENEYSGLYNKSRLSNGIKRVIGGAVTELAKQQVVRAGNIAINKALSKRKK